MPEGRVTAAYGRQFWIAGDDGSTLACVMRGKRHDAAVGDRVEFRDTGGGGGVIEQVMPRATRFARSDLYRTKLFAANLSRIAIVMAPEPAPSESLLFRALVNAHIEGLPTAIIMNKADLLRAPAAHDPARQQRETVAARAALYELLGTPVFRIAAKADPEGARAALAPWLNGETTLLLGQSGMGKSTLVNTLVPDAALATQAISEALGTGRHTTTFVRAFDLAGGGTIVDSPGFQEFGLAHLSASQLQAAVPEIAQRAGACRFNNCTHREEPACAVRAAVETGEMDARRWQLYLEVEQELGREKY